MLQRQRRAFAIGFGLNLSIVVLEVLYGIASSSLALVADAGHNLVDVLGLVLAGAAVTLSRRKPSLRRTYGLRRLSILGAFANAVVLLVAMGGVGWEAIHRLREPGPVNGATVAVVAGVSAILNAISAMLFLADRKRDMNLRAVFVHLAGDTALALGVAVAGVIIAMTGFFSIDPIVSLALVGLVLVSTWSLLRGSLGLLLDVVPEGIDPDKIRGFFLALPGVREVHDLHIWGISTTETALTAHLVVGDVLLRVESPQFLADVCKILHDQFRIEHATLQLEPEEARTPCRLAPDDIV